MADGAIHPTTTGAPSAQLQVLIDALISQEGYHPARDREACADISRAINAAYDLGAEHSRKAAYRFDLSTGGREQIGEVTFLHDAKGRLVRKDTVPAKDLLMDEVVRRMIGHALGVSGTVARFKQHSLNDVSELLALFDQDYGVTLGGKKGNVSLISFDGTLKVQLQVADRLTFGPELQSAKKLVDECLIEWTSDEKADLQAMVQRAFNTDQEGKINRAELFSLLRVEFQDERMVRAMQAVRDSIRVEGTKEYIRFYRRETPSAGWEAITIDMAAA